MDSCFVTVKYKIQFYIYRCHFQNIWQPCLSLVKFGVAHTDKAGLSTMCKDAYNSYLAHLSAEMPETSMQTNAVRLYAWRLLIFFR